MEKTWSIVTLSDSGINTPNAHSAESAPIEPSLLINLRTHTQVVPNIQSLVAPVTMHYNCTKLTHQGAPTLT